MAPTLKELSDYLSSLDPHNDMEGHAFQLDTKNELGFEPAKPFDFFIATPYGTWEKADSGIVPQPNVLSTAIVAALNHGLQSKNYSLSPSGEKFVFIDFLHLADFDINFIHADGSEGIFDTLCSRVDALPHDVTPVVRFLAGDIGVHRTQFQGSDGGKSWKHYSDLFWPDGKQRFQHPKAKLFIGWYNPDRIKSASPAPTTLPAWAVNLIDAMHDFLLTKLPAKYADGLIAKLRDHALSIIQYADNHGIPSLSWNHAKVVAVNATTLTTGGANLWSDYADKAHAGFDALIKVRGDAAYQGHKYADALWEYLNAIPSEDDASMSYTRSLAIGPPRSAGDFQTLPVPLAGGTSQSVPSTGTQSTLTVNKVGDKLPHGKRYPLLALDALRDAILQLAWLEITQNDQYKSFENLMPFIVDQLSDTSLLPMLQKYNISPAVWASKSARLHALENAQNEIIISQQTLTQAFLKGHPEEQDVQRELKKLLPQVTWDGDVVPFDLLCALAKGLKNIAAKHPNDKSAGVSILLSTKHAGGGNNDPTSWSFLKAILIKLLGADPVANQLVTDRVHVKRIMNNNTDVWLHTKIVCVDRGLMYVGSDNAYPQYNAQHGIWIEDQKNIAAWYDDYFAGAWQRGATATD